VIGVQWRVIVAGQRVKAQSERIRKACRGKDREAWHGKKSERNEGMDGWAGGRAERAKQGQRPADRRAGRRAGERRRTERERQRARQREGGAMKTAAGDKNKQREGGEKKMKEDC